MYWSIYNFDVYIIFHLFPSVCPVQGDFISLVGDPCAKIPHMQSAEQCGGHQPRARKCVYQRGLGAGDTGRDVYTLKQCVKQFLKSVQSAC